MHLYVDFIGAEKWNSGDNEFSQVENTLSQKSKENY